MADKPIGVDADGYGILTEAMRSLLNQYPGLEEGDIIRFEELGKDGGLAFSADSGALIFTETEDVCGVIHQTCQYPFFVVYRTDTTRERQKLNIQKFLDNLGKWVCGEPDSGYDRLTSYPELSGGRKIKRITRSNSYGLEPQENGVQDWLLPITVRYANEYEKW